MRLLVPGEMSGQVRSNQVGSCHVMSCHVMSCHVMSCHVMSSHVMSCHVMSGQVRSGQVMSCHVMSCHVMSCHSMLGQGLKPCDVMLVVIVALALWPILGAPSAHVGVYFGSWGPSWAHVKGYVGPSWGLASRRPDPNRTKSS